MLNVVSTSMPTHNLQHTTSNTQRRYLPDGTVFVDTPGGFPRRVFKINRFRSGRDATIVEALFRLVSVVRFPVLVHALDVKKSGCTGTDRRVTVVVVHVRFPSRLFPVPRVAWMQRYF